MRWTGSTPSWTGAGGPVDDPARPAPSRLPAPASGDLPADIAERLLAVQEKSGFVPNVFLLLARRPDAFRAFLAYHDLLMDRPGPLTRAEMQAAVAGG